MTGERTLLTGEQQLALVRWIVKTSMVFEFTGSNPEQKYFTEAERRAFKENFAIPPHLWIWLARYDGGLPLHSIQFRGPKAPATPTAYSFTFGSNFFVAQVFAHRDPELARFPVATKGPRFPQIYPSPGASIFWPPENTIDDYELQELDLRFTKVIGGRVGCRASRHLHSDLEPWSANIP